MTDSFSNLFDPDADFEATELALLTKLENLLPAIADEAQINDEHASLPEARLRELHSEGFDAALLPAELGGGGASYAFYGSVVRALAAADPAVATVWTMHLGAGVGLAQLTRGTLGDYYAKALVQGDRFANALSEPTSGNRFLNPQQEARAVENGYVLEGAKRFVSGSEIADHLQIGRASCRERGDTAG